MTTFKTIHIPYALARLIVSGRSLVNKYETNRVIKSLDTWLILKSDSRSSLIQDWNKQKNYLLTICKVSESIFRSRLKTLQAMKLLQVDKKNIRLCSWHDLGVQFECDTKSKFSIQYDYTSKQRIQDWIIAIEIKERQSRQDFKILQRVNKNPLIQTAFTAEMIRQGADSSQVNKPGYFLSWLNILYRSDFVMESAIHDLLVLIRPDHNRGVKAIADHWTAKSPSTVSYWKKILEKTGIVYISKLQIESRDRVRNSECKVLWLQKPKQTLLCLCDGIEVLTPWLENKSLKTIYRDYRSNENISHKRLSA